MSLYQKKNKKANKIVKIIDEEKVLETAEQGLRELCITMGLEVMQQILEADVIAHAGERGKHDEERQAYRHGRENTKVVSA